MSGLSTRWSKSPAELAVAAYSNRVSFFFRFYIGHADLLFSWIYTLYLAMDANFRLKLRNRHIKNDPELGPGWAYCVEEKPYQEEMDQYGDQIEVQLIFVLIIANY